MLNWVLSLFVHKGLLAMDEAEKIAKELPRRVQPTDFKEAHKIVNDLLAEVDSAYPKLDISKFNKPF